MIMLSFVIPCYGSKDTIDFVINEIIEKVSERQKYDYEIITINDASPDNVMDDLRRIASENKRVRVIDFAINKGKESAKMAGYRIVKGDYIVNLDDDGQCPMSELWQLIDKLEEGYDVVIANYPSKKQSLIKNVGSEINRVMAKSLVGLPRKIKNSNFSVYRRFVIDEIAKYNNPYPYSLGVMLQSTTKIVNVTMEERERYAGKSNFSFKRSVSLWLNGFTSFSVKPLRISSVIGFVSATIGFAFGVVTVIRKLTMDSISVGWSSIVSIMLFLGGMIMMLLGMIGEYIGRIYISQNMTSQYVIRETINIEEEINERKD